MPAAGVRGAGGLCGYRRPWRSVQQLVGYFPTGYTAWNQLTGGPMADQTDVSSVAAMQRSEAQPSRGALVAVTIGAAASGFAHRDEWVYLPPAWFARQPVPRLPAIMMIGGEFNTPADWVRAGEAVSTLDRFAAAHGGYTPVVVFVDPSGAFDVDTECVNGPRGRAADHLTEDVVPYLIATFGVSADPSKWGVVGFSAGGTCAVDLAVMHPSMFGTFIDIAGDLGPNAGTKAQTIDRLFGGDADAWSAFDPSTVIARHGRYGDVAGLFAVAAAAARSAHGHDQDAAGSAAADSLCALGKSNGITCAVVALPGKHDWPFAGRAFAATLPRLAGRLNTVPPQITAVPS